MTDIKTSTTPIYHKKINQIEVGEFATGGPDGNINQAPKQLAENIEWLKQDTDQRIKGIEEIAENVVSSEFGQSKTTAVSQKLFTDTVIPTINNIGEQGSIAFGSGIAPKLPSGMSEMFGTRIKGHQNYGNYQYQDESIMVWIPRFYYRWGAANSPRAALYYKNSLDVKSIYDFSDVAAANAAGYSLHRAFYDDGKVKDGFFVDKYLCSNNKAVASSIRGGNPLSSSSANNPFSELAGNPSNNLAGSIDAVKTRGTAFFVTTIFIQRALSLLSMAHAQAATSSAACAWFDSTGVNNFPKGCNNNALRDTNDTSVVYEGTGYLTAGKTGSATLFAKTTHNGQDSGVADLNGNMWEVALGLTQKSGAFYALKTTAKASALTSGSTLVNDAWGTAGLAKNYESLGASIGEMSGEGRNFTIGSVSNQVFSSAQTGNAWLASCAGIPQLGGGTGANLFGNDRFYDNRTEDLCALSGGTWNDNSSAGVWWLYLIYSRARSYHYVGVRAALYH